jgi:two-component system, NtrC family, sensor kinase
VSVERAAPTAPAVAGLAPAEVPAPGAAAPIPLVTDRGALERQLSHSERLASLGILAAGVAHEINNPLASLLAGVEALRRRLLDPQAAASAEDVARLLDILERETRRVRDIADKLMLLARPESEKAAWFNLNRAVDDTATLLGYQMNVQRIRSVIELAPGLPCIWAREGAMRSVCLNIMMNALQAMPKGGMLTARTRFSGTAAVLEVDDTGTGIPPEIRDRIWDPFFTTKPPGKGTGLGLSISQSLVSRQGGVIRTENLTPNCARFTVELPIQPRGGDDG